MWDQELNFNSMERSLNSTEPPAVPAASAARAGRVPDSRPARGRGARPRVPETLLVLGVLMLRLTDVATSSPVRDGSADLQELEQNSSKGLCPEGQYLKENGDCKPCTDGIDFTDYPNDLPSCRPCRKCKLDEDQKSRCTPTTDTECQCKQGTFREKDDTEHCQKCTVCTNREIEKSPCSSLSDRTCVPSESYTNVTGKPVNTTLETWKSQRISVLIGITVGIAVMALVIFCIVWKTRAWNIIECVKSTSLGCWRNSECVNSRRSTTMNSQTSSSTSGSHNSTISPAVEAPEGSAEAESSPTGGEFQEIEMTLIRDIHEPSPTEQAAFLQSRIPD